MKPAWIIAPVAVGLVALSCWALLTPAPLHRPPNDPITIQADPASIAHGKHLVEAIAVCTVCHGDDLGGKLAFDDPVLGHGYTANLTSGSGGIGGSYAVQDWVRSIRYGVRPDGTAIRFMPSDFYNSISDSDLGAMIAYLTRLPPVDNQRTHVELNPWARLLIDIGMFGEVSRTARIDFSRQRQKPPADDGAYLVGVAGCTFCHGPQLKGGQGPEPGAPNAPDLTTSGTVVGGSEAGFAQSLRNGIATDGHVIRPKYMPWLGYRRMTDPEITAIWHYIQKI